MRIPILAALALAGLLAACETAGTSNLRGTELQPDSRNGLSGHFGAGMHAGRVSGR